MKIKILVLVAILTPSTSWSSTYDGETGYYCTDENICKKGDTFVTKFESAAIWCDLTKPMVIGQKPGWSKVLCVHRGESRLKRE